MAGPDLSRWEGGFVHEVWTTKDGLPVNSINSLLQTRDGYIWAGTFDGLVRFDGVRFTVFNSSTDENLPSNRILGLFEARDRTLWITTQSHLVRFRNRRFEPIGPAELMRDGYIRVYEDLSGRIWVMTTDGLGRMEDDRLAMVLPSTPDRIVSSVIQRRDGSLWAGTRRGDLLRLVEHPTGSRLRAVAVAVLDSSVIRTMSEDASGRLYIGTSFGIWTEKNGLERVESEIPIGDVVELVASPGSDAVFAYAVSGIFRLVDARAVAVDARARVVWPGRPFVADSAGSFWYSNGSEVGRDGRTVLALDPDPGDRLSSAVITSMVVDHDGSTWIGTRSAGLHRVKPSFITTLSESEGISHRNVYPIHQDLSGDVWVGTYGNGLNRIDASGRITSYTPARGSPTTIHSLHADRTNRLWVGAATGLFACSLPAMVCAKSDAPTPGIAPFALFEDSRGRLWAGFSEGPMRLEDGQWTLVPEWPDAGPVRAFAETPDSAIWMGTNGGGLVRYRNGSVSRVTSADGLPIDLVRALYVDTKGQLWIGTEGRGLARLDPMAWREGSVGGDRRIVSIRSSNGLFDEVIHQILGDDAGRMWMSTNRGIFWVDREQLNAFAEGRVDHVRSTGYTEGDGLRHREANGGVQPAGMRARDGRLWFPTQDGVAIIDPDDIATGRVPPPVVVEHVVAGDSGMVLGAGALEFGVEQRDLEIGYTAPSFLQPANIGFRYRLDPYDEDWVDAGPRRTAFYTRVPPGRYTFRVMASNDPGVWSGAETSIDFLFRRRFRETRAALVLAVASFALVLAAGYRRRVGNLRRRERELTDLVELRTTDLRHNEQQLAERNSQLAAQAGMLAELHESRSRLFANLSHELRTPLTLILGPLRSLMTGRHGSFAPSVSDQHDLMLRNGERLLGLINQILDMSSSQAGALTLKPATADLVGFARDITSAFAPLADRGGIDLRFQTESTELIAVFDAEQLEKVLLNLLANAVSFTGAGGTVELVVRAAGTVAEIVVRDTGEGIAPTDLPHVFDRFYQANTSTTRRHGGTGIGLALARELVELHDGEISAESTPGVGSTFTVRLPISGPAIAVAARAGIHGDEATDSPVRAAFVAPPPAQVRTVRPQAIENEGDDRTTVLVVDDNADVRTYVRSILDGTYGVIEAADGVEGLETARARLPDIIVADVMMPRLDGLALGRALKEDPLTDAIPLVLLTARAATEDHVAGLETGADTYLVKPFHPDILEASIENLLRQRRRLRERFRQGEETPPATTPDPQVALDRQLRPLVEARLADPDFGPDALAAAADLSYHQLYRALRDELGVTPSGFIRRVRVECAAELLRMRAAKVTEIAYSVGFESLSYFRRAFHERFNTSPTSFLASEP